MSRRVLVTGGQGFIGCRLVRELLERGDEVVVLDLLAPSVRGLEVAGIEADVELVSGSVFDPIAVRSAVAGTDTVFHLAAVTLVGPAAADPPATFRTNVEGTWTVLEQARAAGVDAVVVASSDKAYGPSPDLPYREGQELRPASPYEGSKAAADVIARSYWKAFGLPVGVTRLANVYGGGDLNGSRLMPELITAMLAGRSAVIRSDGTPQRDFLHVSDAVAAYLAIEEAVRSGPGRGEALNAGTGAPHSVRTVVELAVAAIRRLLPEGAPPPQPRFEGGGVPEGEIERQYVDSSRLRQLTGWTAAVPLEEGIAEAVSWYRDHPGRSAS